MRNTRSPWNPVASRCRRQTAHSSPTTFAGIGSHHPIALTKTEGNEQVLLESLHRFCCHLTPPFRPYCTHES